MILPHKKSLKGTSYAKQVARRRSEVRGVSEFQMRERGRQGPGAEGFSPRGSRQRWKGGAQERWRGAAPPLPAGRKVRFL